MQTWYNAFHFSGQFYEKWMSVRERNINLLLEAVTCMATMETATCIIAIESVSCIVPTETATCRIDYRNFHSQKWCQSETLLVIIKKFSEWVRTKFKAK